MATIAVQPENQVENVEESAAANEVVAQPAATGLQLVIGTTVTGRVAKAQSRTNSLTKKSVFLLWLAGSKSPIIVAQSIVSGKGYIDDSQFIGKTISVTPTQETSSIDARTGEARVGYLADLEMLPAVAGFIELKMNHAARYQVAAQYAVNAAEEV